MMPRRLDDARPALRRIQRPRSRRQAPERRGIVLAEIFHALLVERVHARADLVGLQIHQHVAAVRAVSNRQRPDRSGLPSAVRGAGAVRFGLPSAVRGMPLVGSFSHWACDASAVSTSDETRRAISETRHRGTSFRAHVCVSGDYRMGRAMYQVMPIVSFTAATRSPYHWSTGADSDAAPAATARL